MAGCAIQRARWDRRHVCADLQRVAGMGKTNRKDMRRDMNTGVEVGMVDDGAARGLIVVELGM